MYDITFWGYAFSLSMVFLMPKMLDRFYFIASCLIIILMFSYFEKFTCIMGVLTTAFFSLTILNAVYEFTILGSPIAMLIISFINFGFMIYMIIEKYVKPLKQNKEREYKQ